MNANDNDVKNSNDGDILDIGVSVDGSWQRRRLCQLPSTETPISRISPSLEFF